MAKVLTIKMSVRFELVMRTASGVELFYNPNTNTYISKNMDAVITAIIEDIHSNDSIGALIATSLFEHMQNATLISE